ncbi:PadR family transcriptional regulator [Gemmatimonadota bacterium]
MELLLLSLLEDKPRHGYEIGRQIEEKSGGRLQFRVSSMYPVLCRMEDRGWIKGYWVEKPGERRRKFYELTPKGEKALAEQRETWEEFKAALTPILDSNSA